MVYFLSNAIRPDTRVKFRSEAEKRNADVQAGKWAGASPVRRLDPATVAAYQAELLARDAALAEKRAPFAMPESTHPAMVAARAVRPVVRITCAECGLVFDWVRTSSKQPVSCSKDCATTRKRRHLREWKAAHPNQTKPRPAPKLKVWHLACCICGGAFDYSQRNAKIPKTCSRTCRLKLRQDRRRTAREAAQKPAHACLRCGEPCHGRRRVCSDACLDANKLDRQRRYRGNQPKQPPKPKPAKVVRMCAMCGTAPAVKKFCPPCRAIRERRGGAPLPCTICGAIVPFISHRNRQRRTCRGGVCKARAQHLSAKAKRHAEGKVRPLTESLVQRLERWMATTDRDITREVACAAFHEHPPRRVCESLNYLVRERRGVERTDDGAFRRVA